MSISSHSARPHTRWRFTLIFGFTGALVVSIIVLAFVWPAATATARDLPVGIAGPAAQVEQLKQALAEQDPSPFTLVAVDSRDDAVNEISQRHLYGAILLGDSPEVLTSSAASTISNQALRGVATALQAKIDAGVETALVAQLQKAGTAVAGFSEKVAALQQALATGNSSGLPAGGPPTGAPDGSAAQSASGTPPTVKITDIVALASTDKTGAGLTAASFPIVLGGMLGGVLVSLLVVGVFRRLLALLIFGAAAGTLGALVLQTWFQVLQRDWLINAAALGLAMAATATLVVGFNSLLGPRGIAVGAVLSTLIGNPISGATLPYQFLASPWGEIGRYMVPGAASNLIRSLSYFPNADAAPQWITLVAWTLGGILLITLGHFRSAAPIKLPAAELEPQTAPATA